LIVQGSGAALRSLGPTEKLCLAASRTGATAANDVHIYTDTESTTGASGQSRLEGPFS
jgi:hypothetical protein